MKSSVSRFFILHSSFFICFIFFIFHSTFATAQETEDLQQRAEQLQEAIQMAKTWRQTQANARQNETQLNALNERISSRQALLDAMADESDLLSSNIDTLNAEIANQKEHLAAMKENYARMLQYIQTQCGNKNKWLYILSAENFSQTYRRFRYIQELTAHTDEEMELIKQLTAQLETKKREVLAAKNRKLRLAQQQKAEMRKLSAEQKKQAQVVKNLKQQEAELLAAIRKRERQTEGLSNRIQANVATETQGRLSAQQERQLTQNFERNKGRLPMPVERGYITARFGKQQHPVLKNITTNNKGINIKTIAGADALAVFDGVVAQRFAFPGYNNAVIVRHGNYRTVYSNLTDVFVNEGDVVSARQPLGRVFTDKANGNVTELLFLLYKGKELQNPELFLRK